MVSTPSGTTVHVNSSFNKDHESITTRPSQDSGSVVEMSHGLLVLTRQPGTHARPAAGGGRGRSIKWTERRRRSVRMPCPAVRCTLGNPGLTCFRRRPSRGAACFVFTGHSPSPDPGNPVTAEWDAKRISHEHMRETGLDS